MRLGLWQPLGGVLRQAAHPLVTIGWLTWMLGFFVVYAEGGTPIARTMAFASNAGIAVLLFLSAFRRESLNKVVFIVCSAIVVFCVLLHDYSTGARGFFFFLEVAAATLGAVYCAVTVSRHGTIFLDGSHDENDASAAKPKET